MTGRQVTPRFKEKYSKGLVKFDPRKTTRNLATIKAAIAQARKLADPEFFREAVEEYVAEQERFVAWWDASVRGKGERSNVAKQATFGLLAEDAEAQTGVSKFQVSRWRGYLAEHAEYVAKLCYAMWKTPWARRDREQLHAEDEERVKNLRPLPGKFRTLVVDPPWDYDWLSLAGRAKPGYATMKHDELLALDVAAWAEDDCHLYCWTTNNFITRAVELVEAWGFEHKTVLTWVKPRWGLGAYFRNQTEHVLFAVRGELRTRRDDISTIISGEIGEHSEKPEMFYDLVRAASWPPYGEAFQRKPRPDFANLFTAKELMSGRLPQRDVAEVEVA